MSGQTVFKQISARAKALLGQQEGLDVDFKKTASAVTEEFLAAFANSHAGGAILVGVEEGRASNGLQSAQVVGCTVGDREKLTLLNKALGCSPPVQIQVIVENLSRCPFLRVEIPSSPHRPHCTSSGKYVIRGDERNEPLIPERLLGLDLRDECANRTVEGFGLFQIHRMARVRHHE